MQKNIVLVSFIVVVLVAVNVAAAGCKVCGNPWCSGEDIQEQIELSIVGPSSKHHCWKHHDEPCSCGASKCSHPKCESDSCSHGHSCKGHSKECKECGRDCGRDCSKDCGRDCCSHKGHGRDCKSSSVSSSSDHKGVRRLECRCKTKHRHDC